MFITIWNSTNAKVFQFFIIKLFVGLFYFIIELFIFVYYEFDCLYLTIIFNDYYSQWNFIFFIVWSNHIHNSRKRQLFTSSILNKELSTTTKFMKKGLSVYVYCAITNKLIIILPFTKEAERHLKIPSQTLIRYAESHKFFKGKFILSLTPLDPTSLPSVYSYSSKYSLTSCSSMTIWDQNLYSLVGYKLNTY